MENWPWETGALVETENAYELLVVPKNGSVSPPGELAIVSVDPEGVIVTFDPAASVTAS
jgi:hypothetical protein